MANSPKQGRREVRLNDGLQKKLLEQMREERDARARTRVIRRYVALPLAVLATGWSIMMCFDADTTNMMVGNVVASSLVWFFWKVRKRLPAIFGFG